MRGPIAKLLSLVAAAALAWPAAAQTGLADRAAGPQEGPTPGKPGEPATKPPEKEAAKEDKNKKEKKDEWLAVLNGDVHTITDGVYRGATILCRNGKIQAIGYDLAIPKEAATLDAAGLSIYPGLIAVASSGVIGQEPVDYSTDVFSLQMTFALACGWTTMASGNSAGKLTHGTLDGLLLRGNLWQRMSYMSGDERRRVRSELEAAREFLRKKRLYDQQKAAGQQVEEPKPEGVNENWLKLLGGDLIARFDANSAEDLRAIAKLVTEYGFKAVIFGATEGWIVAEELGRAGVSCVINPHTPRTFDRALNRLNGATIENAAILNRHGVKVGVTPASARLSQDGLLDRDLRTPTVEAALAVRGGLPRDAAEATLTINAARILGVDDRVGSLQPGKDADFIVLDGELLDYDAFVQYTVVNGRLVYDKAKESLFRDLRPRPSTYQEPRPPEPPPEEKPEEKKETPAPAEGEKKEGEKKEDGKPDEKPKDDPKPAEPPSPAPPPGEPPKPDGTPKDDERA